MSPLVPTRNPVLDEIDQAHAGLSPEAQQAISLANPKPDLALSPEVSPAPDANAAPKALATPSPRVAPLGNPQPSPDQQAHLDRYNHLVASPPGVDQIHNGFLHGLAKVGDVTGSILIPGAMANIPGTSLHHQQLVNQSEGILKEDQQQQESAAKTSHENAQAGLENAQAEDLTENGKQKRNIPLKAGEGLFDVQTGKWTVEPTANSGDVIDIGEENGKKLGITPIKGRDGQLRYVLPKEAIPAWVAGQFKEPKEAPHVQDDQGNFWQILPDGTAKQVTAPGGSPLKGKSTETGNEQERNVQSYLKEHNLPDNATNRGKAMKFFAEQTKEPGEGTWAIAEDSQGKPILFNSKTGQTRAANGVQRSGTEAKADAAREKETGPAKSALEYAESYLKNGVFTGAGDEALQEKFFELAKPATGFRMTQPQMDMLQNSRGWMESFGAKMRHATSGTWFDQEQRKQIVNTMKDLAAAKLASSGKDGAGGAVPTVTTKEQFDALPKGAVYMEDGKQYRKP